MVSFATLWPWIGLGAAGMLLLLLAGSPALVDDRRVPRWHDLGWLVFAALALTLLHQFEENGLDLTGRPAGLLNALCTGFGFRDAVACPVPLSVITGFNVGTVWIAALIAVLTVHRHPLVGLTVFAVPLGTLILHIGAAVGLMRYNSGLATALLLLPLAAWTLLVAGHRHGAGPKAFAALFAAAVLSAAVTFALLLAARHAIVGDGVIASAFALLGLLPAGLMLLATRRARPPVAPAPKARTRRPPARAQNRTQAPL